MSHPEPAPPWYLILLVLMLAIVVGLFIVNMGHGVGKIAGRNEMLDEAVRHYKAEYYLDDNNQRQWRWKP